MRAAPVLVIVSLLALSAAAAMVSCRRTQPVVPAESAPAIVTDPRYDPTLEVVRPPPSYHAITSSDESPVNALAWLPDSVHLVLATETHVELWRTPSRHLGLDTPIFDAPADADWLPKLVWKAPLREDFAARRLTLSSDGKLAAVAGLTGVEVHDLADGRLVLERPDLVRDAHFVGTGELWAIAADRESIVAVDLARDVDLHSVAAPFAVDAFALSADGAQLALCRRDGVALVDALDGAERWRRPLREKKSRFSAAPAAPHCAIAWQPAESLIFSHVGARLYALRAVDGVPEVVQNAVAQDDLTHTIDVTLDDEVLFADEFAFSSSSLERLGRVGHRALPAPDGSRIAFRSIVRGQVALRDRVQVMTGPPPLTPHTDLVIDAVWDPDSRTLLSIGWDHQVKRWDLERGEVIAASHVHNVSPLRLDTSRVLIDTGAVDTVDIIDARTLAPRDQALDLDGELLSFLGDDRVWRLGASGHSIIDVSSGEVERSFRGRLDGFPLTAVSPDRRWFAAQTISHGTGQVLLFHRDDGRVRRYRGARGVTLTDEHIALTVRNEATKGWSVMLRELATDELVARCDEPFETSDPFDSPIIVDATLRRVVWSRAGSIYSCSFSDGTVERRELSGEPLSSPIDLGEGRIGVLAGSVFQVRDRASFDLLREIVVSRWSSWTDFRFVPDPAGHTRVLVATRDALSLWEPFEKLPFRRIRDTERELVPIAVPHEQFAVVEVSRTRHPPYSGELTAIHATQGHDLAIASPQPAGAWRLSAVSPSGRIGVFHAQDTHELAIVDLVNGEDHGRAQVSPETSGAVVSDHGYVAWIEPDAVKVADVGAAALSASIPCSTQEPIVEFLRSGALSVNFERYDPASPTRAIGRAFFDGGWCSRVASNVDFEHLSLFEERGRLTFASTSAPGADFQSPILSMDDRLALARYSDGVVLWDLTTLTPVAGLTIAPDGRWNSWADPEWQPPSVDPDDPCAWWRTPHTPLDPAPSP